MELDIFLVILKRKMAIDIPFNFQKNMGYTDKTIVGVNSVEMPLRTEDKLNKK